MIIPWFSRFYFFFLLVLFPLLFLGSCKLKEKLVYLNNSQIDSTSKPNNFKLKLKVDDILSVNISDLDNETVALFYSKEKTNSSLENGYLISLDGNISIPVLGMVKVVDLTITEAEQVVTNKLKEYLKNPVVQIRLLNFKITVLGDVTNAGSFNISSQRISILDAIGMAGDLSITGLRKNILVIRENNGKTEEFRLDLTSKSMRNSPAFYLEQNDVVYVEPNISAKFDATIFKLNAQFLLSGITSIFTILILLIR
jgi:polysaccharide export outer membrane protein